MKRLVLAILAAVPLQGAAQEERWDFSQLMSLLGQVQTSKARYSEVKRLSVLRQPLRSSGTLTYARPATIEKHQMLPIKEVMRVEGDLLTVEREGRSRSIMMQGAPLIGVLVESLRATLAGDGAELERLYTVRMEGTRRRWTLELVPRDFEVANVVKRIAIAGAGSRVARFEIMEPGGDNSVMTIHHES